ncbi:MAG TPA: hypothetical protein PKL14_04315 [Holophaga sp.]|nr:hypothetical protein [Holophaga sp.]
MNRFGSSRLRIVWASLGLLLAGIALGAIQGFGSDGNSLAVFGTSLPLGMDPRPMVLENIGRMVYTLVPAIILLGGFLPVGEWLGTGSRGERYKGLMIGSGLAFAHGLFLSQIALLPILAATFKLFGSPFAQAALQSVAPGEPIPPGPWTILFRADLNAVLLGLQLLLWTVALGLVLKSNRGLAILFAYSLAGIGKLLSWVSEFGDVIELPKFLVKTTTFLFHVLPTESLPSNPFAWTALPLSVGGPLVLAGLLLLLPNKTPKKSKA